MCDGDADGFGPSAKTRSSETSIVATNVGDAAGYRNSHGAPTVLAMGQTLLTRLLTGLPGAATRALVGAGITDVHGLARHTEAEIEALHGTGPKAMATLRDALAEAGLTFRPPDDSDLVDQYLRTVRAPHRGTLEALRATLRIIVPHAYEWILDGAPAMRLDDAWVARYAAAGERCVFSPMSEPVLAAAGNTIDRYERTTDGLAFAPDRGLPGPLVAALVRLRLDELSAVRNGLRREYFPDGRLKAAGTMNDGQPDGHWCWYRTDGSLLHTGNFDRGERVGSWETWNRDGSLDADTQDTPEP